MIVTDEDVKKIESILLPENCHFAPDAKNVICRWDSYDVSACPGSGKTTVLLAKLKLLADKKAINRGEGVCVLSHTNVAVDEIKSKLSDCADVLLNYPNYVGTIQSFIDKYVVFPYLSLKTSSRIQVVSDEVYAAHFYDLIWRVNGKKSPYYSLRYFLKNKVDNGAGLYADEKELIQSLYLKNGDLHTTKAKIAGSDSPSAKQYVSAVQALFMEEGMIRYKDTYQYAIDAMNELSEEYTSLFSKRFKYVFIDEYQDCTQFQRDTLEKLFNRTKCNVVRIGDPDQAIYNNNTTEVPDWLPDTNALTIKQSNRYGQEIADVISNLTKGNEDIVSSIGNIEIRPTLIVYDDNSIGKVIETFLSVLDENNLIDPNGVYKAIGMVENVSGIRVSSYWDGFSKNTNKSESVYGWYLEKIREALTCGKLYKVDEYLCLLVVKIYRYLKIINPDSMKGYSISSMKKLIREQYYECFRDCLLNLCRLETYDIKSIHAIINIFIKTVCVEKVTMEDNLFKYLPDYFVRIYPSIQTENNGKENCFNDITKGRVIQFDTVHGVKGETHDATLYLETEKNKSSDIKRVLPYWGIGKVGKSKEFEYSRKCVYVGFSRPKKLLCVAVKKSTYDKGKSYFENWIVKEI